MNTANDRFESTIDSKEPSASLWTPIGQNESPDQDSWKRRRRKFVVLLIVVGLIGFPIWCYSNFDPSRWAWRGYFYPVALIVRIDPEIVNRRDEDGFTLLYAAASGGHPEIVELLLAAGADPNRACHNDQSTTRPVWGAADNGDARVMKALIDAGADLHLVEKLGDEPLILTAARNGHLEVVRLLLDEGADPNANNYFRPKDNPEIETGFTVLEQAAMGGHADVVKLLLERGAKVQDFTNDFHRTALHTYCSITSMRKQDEGYDEWVAAVPAIVDLLVAELGDVNFGDGFGNTPLHEAAGNSMSNSVHIIRHLVQSYPELDVNAIGYSGRTPLHKAMINPRSLHAVKYLVDNCPDLDVNAIDEYERTPLHIGARFGNAPGVKYLLENARGLNVNAPTSHGMTPLNTASSELREASREKRKEKVEALKEIIKLLETHGGKHGKYRI